MCDGSLGHCGRPRAVRGESGTAFMRSARHGWGRRKSAAHCAADHDRRTDEDQILDDALPFKGWGPRHMHEADAWERYERKECARHLRNQEANGDADERSPEHAHADRDSPPFKEWDTPARINRYTVRSTSALARLTPNGLSRPNQMNTMASQPRRDVTPWVCIHEAMA